MRIAKRSAVTLAVAAFVPLLLLGIFYIASHLQQMQREAEDVTLTRAAAYLGRVDGTLNGDLGALSVLASSQFIRSGALREARERASEVENERPHWKNIILTNATAGEQIWQTATSQEVRAAARPDVLEFAARGAIMEVGGFHEAKRECACVTLHRRLIIDGSVYVLTLERDVADFQEALMAVALTGEIAALVDRKGLFLARTAEYQNRLGTPATQYVRAAVAQGGDGIYTGTTYEGLRNRTAYATSELSGWSAHIAVPARTYNLLSAGSFTFAVLAVATALLFAGAVTWYGIRDIAARRREERARLQSQKLEAVGYLSSTVAHDFNNLLAVMTACLRSLGKSDDAAKRQKVLDEGLAAADRGAKLVRRLLAFAREKPLELDCVDLDSTIEEIRDLLVRSLGPDVAIALSVAPDARHVRTNGAQLELVLLNLAVNARDAMPNGGSFSIESKRASVSGFVDVRVKDTGVGMSEQVASNAFEPFFTTKAEGLGTGLGLAQVQLLAKDSGGSIHLETAPGKGALFTLRLPACLPPSSASPP